MNIQKIVRDLKKLRFPTRKYYYPRVKPYITRNGSVLPNKYLLWNPDLEVRFQYYSDKDF